MKTDKPEKNQKVNPPNQRSNQYKDLSRYSGLAFSMAAMIGLGYWIGKTLDGWLNTSFPFFTIGCILLFMIASFYSLIKTLPKN